jgi:hypothetical protein
MGSTVQETFIDCGAVSSLEVRLNMAEKFPDVDESQVKLAEKDWASDMLVVSSQSSVIWVQLPETHSTVTLVLGPVAIMSADEFIGCET